MSRELDEEPEGEFDSVEWARTKWLSHGLPESDHFAALSAVLLISARVGASLDAILHEHSMNRTSYLLMSTLMLAKNNSMSMGRLGRQLSLHAATMSTTVKQMEKSGLVIRGPHPSDGRAILVTLTDKGNESILDLNVKFSGEFYGFNGVTDRLAISLTETIRQAVVVINRAEPG